MIRTLPLEMMMQLNDRTVELLKVVLLLNNVGLLQEEQIVLIEPVLMHLNQMEKHRVKPTLAMLRAAGGMELHVSKLLLALHIMLQEMIPLNWHFVKLLKIILPHQLHVSLLLVVQVLLVFQNHVPMHLPQEVKHHVIVIYKVVLGMDQPV